VAFTPVTVPLAVSVTNAAGSAMVGWFRGEDRVPLSYIGDGSTSEGGFHEALHFAGVFDAPAVTICQNNQWAISVPGKRQTTAETFAQKTEAHGIPYDRVDWKRRARGLREVPRSDRTGPCRRRTGVH
jgi:TPP-dependent pyruvate/acetoin dehydrogenase alpha subunit